MIVLILICCIWRTSTTSLTTATVRSGSEFAEALVDPSTTQLIVAASFRLYEEDFRLGGYPYVLEHNVSITGAENGSDLHNVDMAFVWHKVRLAPGVALIFTNVALTRFRDTMPARGPGISILAPTKLRPGDPAALLILQNVALIQRTCFPTPTQVQNVEAAPRPSGFPGIQNVSGDLPQPGCVNDMAAPLLSRCWAAVRVNYDIVLYGGEIDMRTSTEVFTGYMVLIQDTYTLCPDLLDVRCIAALGPLGCQSLHFANVSLEGSPPAAFTPLLGQPTAQPPIEGGGASADATPVHGSGSIGASRNSRRAGGDLSAGTIAGVVIGVAAGLSLLSLSASIAWGRLRPRLLATYHSADVYKATACSVVCVNCSAEGYGRFNASTCGQPCTAPAANDGLPSPATGMPGLPIGEHTDAAVSHYRTVGSVGCNPDSGSPNSPQWGSCRTSRFPHAQPTSTDDSRGGGRSIGAREGNADGTDEFSPYDSVADVAMVPVTPLTPQRSDMQMLSVGPADDAGTDSAAEHEVRLLPATRGSGAFGRVVEGIFRGQRVAVKLVADTASWGGPEEELLRSFAQEAEVLGRCTHPNVVRLLAACLTPPRLCLVMELMDTSLAEVLYGDSTRRWLPMPQVLHIATKIARGLEYLHPTVTHRDLKPANVLLSSVHEELPVVKIGDFGLSRLHVTLKATQRPEAGTPAYLAPEAFDTFNDIISHQADIYSFGVILWELLSGCQPWRGLDPLAIAYSVKVFNRRPPLEVLRPDRAHPTLRRLLAGCWEADPRRRPAAAELVKELLLLQAMQNSATVFGPPGDEPGLASTVGNTAPADPALLNKATAQNDQVLTVEALPCFRGGGRAAIGQQMHGPDRVGNSGCPAGGAMAGPAMACSDWYLGAADFEMRLPPGAEVTGNGALDGAAEPVSGAMFAKRPV